MDNSSRIKCNLPISLEAQVYDANINDNKQQEDDENVGTSETEEVQNNTIDVNNMVAVAIQRGQETIARMLENVYIDDCNYPVTTEEELREIEEELPGFMHENGFTIKQSGIKYARLAEFLPEKPDIHRKFGLF